jgi:GH24 family phage-related lysozyme (muramidase)
MSSSNVLKEFLVAIGFKVDEQGFRNFQEGMRAIGKNAAEVGKATVAATAVIGASLKALGQQSESLYFASQRTGASAKELREFSFAASQIGVSAEQAQSAIEGLAAARRTNPGLNGILGGMGIDPKQTDNAKVMVELLGKLHSMPHFQAAQVAGMFGINEQTLAMLDAGLPQMQKFMAMREKMFAEAGIDPGKMTEKSHEFMIQVRTLEAGLGNLAEIIGYRLMPAGEKVIGWLEQAVSWLTKADKSTDGWSSKLLGVASALAGGSLLKGGFGMLGSLFGGGGGAAAAGEAAAGGAAAGGGALAGIALPAIIIAAVGAALVWMTAHPEQVRKAVGSAWNATKKEAAALPGQLKGVIASISKDTHDAVKTLGAGSFALAVANGIGPITGNVVGKVVEGTSILSKSLTGLVSQFEGHAKSGYGVYKDIAGHLTAGYGHLVRPGEDFSKGLDKQSALALLAKDLQAAVSSVTSLVKVHLSDNQTKALTDFVFNLGEGNLKKSTLLKKLNAGDFAGAAAEFERWNKVLVNGHLMANKGLTDRRAADASLFRTPDKAVTISQKTDIHVTGGEAIGTGREVARQQDRVNGDLVRNFSGATL